ncbi:precorrin-3B C(17)-methyltransferase [Allocoleopsis franciscana]|uniref:Precorrin-3B C17-methyltransferase n=1 Tax=Allocoleopsis franciscana PCC 7113 TaxID=1173027 RepID=K9WC63_9CYAN|nr:precorrin-3B C(17)-methyltransferase [Allocoleopsis franciscana]AFZ17072.1 precorrin-3B C17-methyltransferase [Allocoleopsis franciscana PCC 7113]
MLLFQDFQPLALVATTPTGAQRLQPLCQTSGASLWVPESLNIEQAQNYTGSLKDHIASLWHHHRAFVFCLATGAVVRLIAPLLEDKSRDPAVVVVDEQGKFVISLCSGHQGKAEQLARMIALQLGATPVLTGASAGLGLPGVDILGVPFGWQRGEGDWTGVSAAVARGERVEVMQEAGSTLWQHHLPQGHPFQFGFPKYSATESEIIESQEQPQNPKSHPPLPPLMKGGSQNPNLMPKAKIWISPTQRRFSPESDFPEVQWHPRVLWVGIGCERGTSRALIETAIEQVCQQHHLAESAIAGIATIDIKADEVGLIEVCRERNWPLCIFPADILRGVNVPNPSAVVDKEVGTPSVAEAAAIFAAQSPALLVPKQIFRSPRQNPQGAVTVAIAQSEREYTGRTGQLLLVGTGPGQLDQITPAAQTAISRADVVIGYSLYIDLIAPLLRPGQIVEALPITQERQRAERAIELAQWGLTVAVVSSGDCGIYGMAGLVLEELRAKGWDGKVPGVQVFPGITALQSAASRVGAPLMHDFCAISLSDLLTPWEMIEKRLIAAAQADFVTALYNPRSRTRTEQIATARAIFLKYRKPMTPVALVRSAYRQDEQITLTTLEKLLDAPIDMLTTVLIGNESTGTHGDWMITPRGYLGFESESTGRNSPKSDRQPDG